MKNKCLNALIIAAGIICLCFAAGCANKAEIILPTGETTIVELEKGAEIINPFDYCDIVFSGYNGYGTAEAVEKYGGNRFRMTLDKSSGLFNGDTVTVTVRGTGDIGSDVISPAYMEFEVEGLQELQELDPFEDIELKFDGISPYVTVSVNTADCSETVKNNVSFSVENRRYAIGESVEVTASYREDRLGELGYFISENSREYTVDCRERYITADEGVDFSETDKNMLDYIEAAANKLIGNQYGLVFGLSQYSLTGNVGSKITEIGNIEECDSWIMSLKTVPDGYSKEPYNVYCKMYSMDISWSGYRVTGTEKLYVMAEVSSISLDEDGSLLYNGQLFNSTVISAQGSKEQAILNSNCIIAKKGDYNITELA